MIVVAHRLSTIDSADQVVFLEPLADGAIVAETGTPKELSSRPDGSTISWLPPMRRLVGS